MNDLIFQKAEQFLKCAQDVLHVFANGFLVYSVFSRTFREVESELMSAPGEKISLNLHLTGGSNPS